jgi:trimeric autotransporter adhesin
MAKQNKGRKFVAASATAALVASAIVPVASAAVNDFNKVAPYAQDAVQYLVDNGVVQGDEKGNFNPKGTITRAEAATIFANFFELEAGEENPFTDVKAGAWYEDAITGAYAAGLVNGLDDTTFGPSKTLTRAEAATLLARAFELEGEADLSDFADAKGLASWKAEALAVAVEYGVITGIEKNGKLYLDADSPITREQFATIFHRTLDATGLIGEEPGEETPATKDTAIVSLTATGVSELTVKFNKAVDTEKAEFKVTKGSTTYTVSDVEWNADRTEAVVEVDTKFTKGTYTATVTGVAEKALTASVETTAEVASSIQFFSNALVLTGEKATVKTSDDSVIAKITFAVYNQYGEDITKTIPKAKYTNTNYFDVDIKGIDDNKIQVTDQGVITVWVDEDEDEGTKGTIELAYEDGDIEIDVTQEVALSDESEPAKVTIEGLYNELNVDFTTANVEKYSKYGKAGAQGVDFYVLLTIKDQYGVTIDAKNAEGNTDEAKALRKNIEKGLRLSVTDDDIFDADEENIDVINVDGKKYFAVALEFSFKNNLVKQSGENTLKVYSKATGDETSKAFTLADSSKVYKIELSHPEDVIAGGERVNVPVTAYDQHGNVIKDASKLNAGLIAQSGSPAAIEISGDTNKVVNGGRGFSFVEVNGQVYLTFETVNNFDDEPYELELEIEVYNDVETEIALDVYPNAYPATLAKFKGDTYLTTGDTIDVKYRDFLLYDQYGREFDLKSTNDTAVMNYTISATPADSNKIAVSGVGLAAGVDTGFVVSSKGGNASVEYLLTSKTTEGVINESKVTVTYRTVTAKDFVSYKVDAESTVYGVTTGETADVTVYGVLANGVEIELAPTEYTIVASGYVAPNGDNTGVNATATAGTELAKQAGINSLPTALQVVVNETGEVITHGLEVSETPLTVASLKFTDEKSISGKEVSQFVITSGVTDGTISHTQILNAIINASAVTATDNYGNRYTESKIDANGVDTLVQNDVPFRITVSNVFDGNDNFKINGNGSTITSVNNIGSGDSFTVTLNVGGASKTVKFVVK